MYLLLISCLAASAQERPDTLRTVEVVADSLPSVLFSSTPLQRLSQRELERINGFSVAEAMRQLAGVQLYDYGGVGGMKTINVRSLGAGQVGLFYNGVQLGNAQNGQVDLGRFSLDNVESISLYNGQQANIFLPAKAFSSASSVWLQSRSPVFDEGETKQVRALVRGGSFGLINPSFSYQQLISQNSNSSVSFNAEWINAHGEYDFRYVHFDTLVRRTNTDVQSLRLESKLMGQLPDSSNWIVDIYGYRAERGLPGAAVSNNFSGNERQWDRDYFAQGKWIKKIDHNYKVQANAKYGHNYIRYLNGDYPNEVGFLQNTYKQQEFYASLANAYTFNAYWDMALSADYQYNKLDANLTGFSYPRRNSLFVNLATTWSGINRWLLQANVLTTYVSESTRSENTAADVLAYAPTVALRYRLLREKPLFLRAFYKHSFRMPTFNDLYYTQIGSTSLNPEYARQYNVGVTYEHAFPGAIKSISLISDAYFNEITDRITAIPTANLFRWTMVNLGRVNITGVDVQVKATLVPDTRNRIDMGLNYNYQQATDNDGNSHTHGQYIPYAPLHSGTCYAYWQRGKLGLHYNFLFSDKRYGLRMNDAESSIPAYGIHDISFSYGFPIGSHTLKLTTMCSNVLSENYQVVRNYYMPERNYRIELNFTY